MRALDRKLFRNLMQLRGQVVAVGLIVACGIASFVTAQSAYRSLRLSQKAYYERYRFAHVFVQLKRAPRPLEPRLAAIPGVAQVRSRVVVDVTLDVPDLDEPASGRLVLIPEQRTPMLNDLYLRRGRYIRPGQGHEVLVSEAFATANALQPGDRLGAVINGRWQQLRIVGVALSPEYVYEISGAAAIFPDNKRFGVLWMERRALATAFDMEGGFNDVVVSLVPQANQAEVMARLDRLLTPYGGLDAYGRDQQTSHRFLSDEISSLQATATVVPSVFLGIAAFLLHVMLSRLVSTQREQIAVLKAFGYGNLAIGWHYLKLVLVIVLLGTALGGAVGLWWGKALTAVYAGFYRFPLLRYEAGVTVMGPAILVSCGAAILGALSAVRGAVALPPAVAMRPEPPARFAPTVLERLGLQRLLTPVGRMILRHLERQPLRAGLSILGIALAVAILILGRYFVDALDRIVTVQFYHAQREDVRLVFREPLSARARYEVARLPGVLRAEPYRTVPVRLRNGHRTYRSVITGLEAAGRLRRLTDQHFRDTPLPADGLVLTTKLAEILRVRPGQRLRIEVLEVARLLRQVVVAGLVDELVGVAAYMDLQALNRLLREGRTVSGALLAVDARAEQALYALLKRTPAVAGVGLRQAALAGFEDTVATTFGVFTSVLVGFACIIAFGVIYNAARIALSERARDLASLRVLGFTRAETAVMLLGEQAVLTLLAIPLGCVLGWGFAALMPLAYNSELYRLPLVISRTTFAFAILVVVVAAVFSGVMVRRRLDRLDLIAVLKTRE